MEESDWKELGQRSSFLQYRKGYRSSAGTGGRQRGRQKDALMPGSDVEAKRSEGCRIKNGGEYSAGPHG